MCFRVIRVLTCTLALLASSATLAAGDNTRSTMPVWLDTFSGQVRIYDFQRFHDNNLANPSVKSALATSAKLFAQTKSLYGFSTALGLYGVTSFGLSPELPRRDTSLMGSRDSFATPAEAFLQYHHRIFQARVGNQLLQTPWVWGSDSRVIPAAYQGISGAFDPIQNLTVDFAYIDRWKSRTNADFETTNLYGVNAPNFWYGGALYHLKFASSDLRLEGWFYRFTDISDLTYLQANYRYHTGGMFDPVAGFQFAHESDTGAGLLGNIDARVWGAEIGIAAGGGTYTLAYDDVPSDSAAFENGNIVSPYTYKYATDPLFTTSMTQGLVDQATSGHAWKAKGVYWLGVRRLWRFIASYARYSQPAFLHPDQTGNPSEVDLDATYFFRAGPLKGFSVRDRLGVFSYSGESNSFLYNRVQLQYDF